MEKQRLCRALISARHRSSTAQTGLLNCAKRLTSLVAKTYEVCPMNKWLYVLALFFLPFLAYAQTLKAVGDPWPPFLDPNHPHKGVATEIAQAAFATQGYTVELNFVPWQRAIDGVTEGEFDILIGTWKTAEREGFLHFSKPYAANDLKLIKRKGDDFQFTDLDSLSGKTIGTVRGYGYGDAFEKASNFNREEAANLMPSVQKLVNGRIDLTLEDELVARSLISKEKPELLSEIEFVSPPLASNLLHVTAGLKNPNHEAIISAFDKGLEIIKANGELDAILKRNGMK
ncbi:substrate-binding periplasmic protein [Pseudomonas anguilliseptica]|uniref:substrate-binding periplasmic protein n=1 Tax=Pseudomonas anguilliseptica TaxID=53406 RepID=UPI00325AE7E9